MDSQEVFNKQEGQFNNTGVPGSDKCFAKLVLLRDCIKDVENDACSIRNFMTNIDNEIFICNEKIKSLLEANQKRIDLLKDLQNKVSLAEYKRSCYIEEFKNFYFHVISNYYNSKFHYNNL